MHKVRIGASIIYANDGEVLSEVLFRHGEHMAHLCGGRGACRKCQVLADGESVLSCQYHVHKDVCVVLPSNESIASETGVIYSEIEGINAYGEMCLCLDIGTTTLALALIARKSGETIKVVTSVNPQICFGADIMNRIEYSRRNGVKALQIPLIAEINGLLAKLISPLNFTQDSMDASDCIDFCHAGLNMYVAANVTMLHIFFGIDCTGIGVSPYTAQFLDSQTRTGDELGLRYVRTVRSLPSIHSFIGADIVAGMNYIGMPEKESYNLLVDLGTNAEIVLYSKEHAICTAAAAGPCFEGANISCGMSATDGAIYKYQLRMSGMKEGNASEEGCNKFNTLQKSSHKHREYNIKTINDKKPGGICGTGLVDVVAELLDYKVDETGFMEEGKYEVTKDIIINQADIRQFQLAKSAVYSAIRTLMNIEGIEYDQIECMYISGGFSASINITNAVKTGLLPGELINKTASVNNSSLLGSIRYAAEQNDLTQYTKNARYIDLSSNRIFSTLFVKNMMFCEER